MKKLISIITAFAVVIAMAGFMPIKANAQMCSYTVYVNGSPYSATASYAVSGNLKVNYSTNTVM